MWNLKRNNANELTKIETHRLRECTYGCQGWGGGIVRKVEMDMYTITINIFKVDNQQGSTI